MYVCMLCMRERKREQRTKESRCDLFKGLLTLTPTNEEGHTELRVLYIPDELKQVGMYLFSKVLSYIVSDR